jgi:hypothetical protein
MTPAENYAIAKLEVIIAWANVEAASDRDELTDACARWWLARQNLRALLIGVS